MPKNNAVTGLLLAFVAALLWSGNYIVARGLQAAISPVSLAFFRWLTATFILLPIALPTVKKQWPQLKPHLRYLSLTALLGITLFNTFIYVAGHYSTAMNLAIIGTSAAPVFVLLLAHFFLAEKAGGLQVAGLLLCIAGILLLISKGHFSNLKNFQLTAGDVWILLAALAFAIYTLLVRQKPASIAPLAFLFSIFSLGTLFLAPAYVVDKALGATFAWSKEMVFVFLYLGAGASVGAFLCWNVAIQKIGSARTALFANLIPVFSTVEAVIILKEKSSGVVVVSMLLILLGLLLANARYFMQAPAKKKA